jgi:hypothetical protein
MAGIAEINLICFLLKKSKILENFLEKLKVGGISGG